MRLSKEVRIGLLVSISLLILFTGFYFLKGANVFSGEREYYCFYENVQGLQSSSNVQIRGLNVGRVSRTQLLDGKGVRVVIAIGKSIVLPKGTVATLASADLLGNKMIRLDLGTGPGDVSPGDSLITAVEGGLIDNLSVQISPLLKDVRAVIGTLDTVLVGVNHIVNSQNQQALSNSIAALNTTTENFAKLSATLNNSSTEISNIVHNANSITTNIAGSNDNIKRILSNLSTTTDQLSKAPISKTFSDLQGITSQLQQLLNKLNSGQGSLGMLVSDKTLYNNLSNSLASLNLLMADLKEHPSHYVNVTVFGKKKK